MQVEDLADCLLDKLDTNRRQLVAIAGPPGAGKSTLAENLCAKLGSKDVSCAIVPMDGFHLDNDLLNQRGLLPKKGAPETFDAAGFVQIVHRLKDANGEVVIPVFDRQRDLAIAGARAIRPEIKVLVVEGNYLLLGQPPWSELAPLWDISIFIDPGLAIVEQRLIDRWLEHGHDRQAATERALGNDIPNARLVLSSSKAADIILEQ